MKETLRQAIGMCLALFALLALAGCAAPKYPYAPAQADKSAATDYFIGPGDGLQIAVWRNPDITGAYPVRPDGKVTIPLVEDMVAAGKTPSQLGRDLEKALSRYVREPVVSVVVTSFGGPYSQQIRVIGQATRPQSLPYRANMSLLDVMIAVGGVTDFADGNRASILRRQGTQQVQYTVRLNDLVRNGDVSANVEMRPGDVLIIPESWF